MEYLPDSPQSLALAAQTLLKGGLVAFPTETVYGLGADAFNPAALAKVFDVKGRPRFDPLIIHIGEMAALEKIADLSLLAAENREKLFLLAEKLWPGPISFILPKRDVIPGIATSGLSNMAVRFPDHSAAQAIISLSSGAVAAPSANPFGYLSPTRAAHVRDMLGEKIDIIIDGGPCRVGVESTVLDLCGETIRVLRPGGIPKETIEGLIGRVESGPLIAGENEIKNGLSSPGQLESHYSPRTPFSVHKKDEIIGLNAEKGSAFIFFDGLSRDTWLRVQVDCGSIHEQPEIRTLSETGSLLEAAASLFEVLHVLDSRKTISRIFAQLAPQTGLGAAINDRLRRAAHKRNAG